MSPTSSSRPFAGRKALSATPRTNSLPSALRRLSGASLGRQTTDGVLQPQTGTVARNLRPLDGWPMRGASRRSRVGAGMVAAGMRDARHASRARRAAAAALAARLRRRAPGRGRADGRRSPRRDERLVPGRAADRRGGDAALEVANTGDRAVPDLAVTVETAPRADGAGARRLRPGGRRPVAGRQRAAGVGRRRGAGGRRLGVRQHVGGRAARRGPDAHRSSGSSRRSRPGATRSRGGSRPRSWATPSWPRATHRGRVRGHDRRRARAGARERGRRGRARRGGRALARRAVRRSIHSTANATSSRCRISRASPAPGRADRHGARRVERRAQPPRSRSSSATTSSHVDPAAPRRAP